MARKLGKIGVASKPAPKVEEPARQTAGFCRDCHHASHNKTATPIRIGGSPGTQCDNELSTFYRWFSIFDQQRTCPLWEATLQASARRPIGHMSIADLANQIARMEPASSRGPVQRTTVTGTVVRGRAARDDSDIASLFVAAPVERQRTGPNRETLRAWFRQYLDGVLDYPRMVQQLQDAGSSLQTIEDVMDGSHTWIRDMSQAAAFRPPRPRQSTEPASGQNGVRGGRTPDPSRNLSVNCLSCRFNERGRCQHTDMQNISVTVDDLCGNYEADTDET